MCRRNIVKVKNVKRNWTFLRFHLLCFGDLSTLNMRTDFSQTTYIWNVASQQQKQSPSASHPTNMINTETGRSWKRRSYSIILFFAFHVHIEKKVHIQQNQWKNVKHTILNQRCHYLSTCCVQPFIIFTVLSVKTSDLKISHLLIILIIRHASLGICKLMRTLVFG